MKKYIIFSLVVFVLSFAAVCFADESVIYENQGMKLSVPIKYDAQIIVETPENSGAGTIFVVSEKASVDAADSAEGAGRLFEIKTVKEEEYHAMLCYDMSGVRVFAKDANGSYYVFRHPTDVRFVRDDYNDEAEWTKWSELNKWAGTVPDAFIAENDGLAAENRGNTLFDMYIARLMYMPDVDYYIAGSQSGSVFSDGISLPTEEMLLPLTKKAVYEEADLNEVRSLSGDFILLSFFRDGTTFRFYQTEDGENYIHTSWNDGEHEIVQKISFEDENIKVANVMNDFYRAMLKADQEKPEPIRMLGVWADNIAGRCAVDIKNKDGRGLYEIEVHWGSSAFESHYWTMTAVIDGNSMKYSDCKKIVYTFDTEGNSDQVVIYENGTGSFDFTDNNTMHWNDEVEHIADGMTFSKAVF